ncbi:hypothetical protein H0E87_027631 [Populus deltoides]|uniref:DNA-binding protein RHL1 n=1 Tax=Populus deltoides TaxID=3696 RepID=A0A8T2WNP9_POPDE|nr:hypothetical protein H0E87_027631 [Populus deltoides]
MVKSKKTEASNSNRENPDVLERKRLKKLAITNNIDIIRKSQRKNRYLPSFPGLLAPVNGGGKIGELKDLSSKSPVLYLDFPQGRMKLLGIIVYPRNRYLTLQFSRSGKNVMCEDYFDHMVSFLFLLDIAIDFCFGDKELNVILKVGQEHVVDKSGGTNYVKEESPETELDDDDDDNKYLKGLKEVMPIRQPARTAGKTLSI